MLDVITLWIVVISAIVSAVNPFTIGALVLLSSTTLGAGRSTGRLLWLGTMYTLTTFAASAVLGLGLLYLLHVTPPIALSYLLLGTGLLAVSAGLLDVKDYFWYGKGLSLRAPKLAARTMHGATKGKPGLVAAVGLGLFTATIMAPSNSAVYLAVIAILAPNFTNSAISLAILYNLMFVAPLVLLLLIIASGTRLSAIQRWKEQNKGRMRLAKGLLAITLGWILILTTSGVLNLG